MNEAGGAAAATVLAAAERLEADTRSLRFADPVGFVYRPLDYAWCGYHDYILRYVHGRVATVFVGMNPGPFGMAQTGVPFGDVDSVRRFLGIDCTVNEPARFHPSRPVAGFACPRTEVSGRRLWGLFQDRFGQARQFFANHFVLNYCPLMFVGASGRNLTPDKLPAGERAPLEEACDVHLRSVCDVLRPGVVVGIGAFAAGCATRALESANGLRVARVLHPSPASPAANRGWAAQAREQLQSIGVWSSA